jgi:hypothetical protein
MHSFLYSPSQASPRSASVPSESLIFGGRLAAFTLEPTQSPSSSFSTSPHNSSFSSARITVAPTDGDGVVHARMYNPSVSYASSTHFHQNSNPVWSLEPSFFGYDQVRHNPLLPASPQPVGSRQFVGQRTPAMLPSTPVGKGGSVDETDDDFHDIIGALQASSWTPAPVDTSDEDQISV